MVKYRRLPLEKLVNARDLGGYAAAGGKITKYGVFLRTDCPVEISEKDWQYLKDYGVTMSIDLRGNDEAANSPSALADVPGHTYVHLSITGEHSVIRSGEKRPEFPKEPVKDNFDLGDAYVGFLKEGREWASAPSRRAASCSTASSARTARACSPRCSWAPSGWA